MTKHGKKFIAAKEKIDSENLYSPREAIELVKEVAFTKFDSTVEIHIRTGLDPRQADQMIRSSVVLPNGLGKKVTVLVFAQGEDAEKARQAGADFVADDDELVNKIKGGWMDFDVVGLLDDPGIMLGSQQVFMPILAAQDFLNTPNRVNIILGRYVDGSDARAIDAAVQSMFGRGYELSPLEGGADSCSD